MVRYFGLYADAHRGKVRKSEKAAHKLVSIEEECPKKKFLSLFIEKSKRRMIAEDIATAFSWSLTIF